MSIPANETYPAGGTWFDTLRKSFVDVPIDAANDNAVPTTEFLEAAESLTTLFGTPMMPLYPEMSLQWLPNHQSPSAPPRRAIALILIKPCHGTDVLGSMAFTPVKNDMIGNIKVRIPWPRPLASSSSLFHKPLPTSSIPSSK